MASFFQAYFGPIGKRENSPEIVVMGVKSQSLFMALAGLFSLFKKCMWSTQIQTKPDKREQPSLLLEAQKQGP